MAQVNNQEQLRIVTADGFTETLKVTWIGPRLARLEDSSLVADARYHDVVEVERQNDGSLRLVRVAQRSALETLSWVLAAGVLEMPVVVELLNNVDGRGGHWEAGAGLLTVHIPAQDLSWLKSSFDGLWKQINDAKSGSTQ